MKDEQDDKKYQEWLDVNQEYLTRFIRDGLRLDVSSQNVGNREYRHTILITINDLHVTNEWMYTS